MIEYDNSIVPSMDSDIADNFYKELKKQGLNFLLSTEVTNAKIKNDKVHLNALSLNETQKVFEFVKNVKKSNRSVLFIGHNIYHVYDISDRFVILDRGEVVHQLNKEEIQSPEELMKLMRDTIKKH